MTAPPSHARASRRDWLVAVLVVLATGVASTWPLATSPWLIPDHQDPLFSSWRLYTWARNLASLGADGWFSGNQFHPAETVLLYSDAILLPALIGAPFILAGVPVLLVYSGLIWLSILSAGLAMYACARYLSGSHFGALAAAILFVGAPLRLDHVMHLELLCRAFLPLAVLATARAFDGSLRGAWGLGASVAAQFLSCIYYGVFLITLWPILAGVEWLRRRGRVRLRIVMHAGAALALAGVVAGAYSVPYQRARQVVGDRDDSDVDGFSGGFDSYVLSPAPSRLWGWTQAAGKSERWLFPGLMGSALAVSAVTAPAAPWVAAVAVTGLVAADASRGSTGLVYPLFRRLLSPYRGLRVPARFGMLMLTMLALLTAIGCGTMARAFGGRPRADVLAALVLLLMGIETLANVPVRRMPTSAPPIYKFLGTLPPSVVAHAPLPRADRLPGFDADFIYFAQYHRHEIVNGNSGFYPPNYMRLLAETTNLPGNRSMTALRQAGVEYRLVHERDFSTPDDYGRAIFGLEARGDLDPLGTWADEPGRGEVRVYRLRRE
ncbi:MAG: hypothetical protein IT181_09990 [Acidobacteria bacterium]|nr:hypothetical protein [Acidobacteriota bacterium]